MNFNEAIESMTTREDFIRFVRELGENYRRDPESWENDNLGTYFDALAAWVEGMEGYYVNTGQSMPKNPDWKMMANILIAAKVFE